MSTPSVFWFRRDLRLADHPALAAAAAAGPVLGVFVVDDVLYDRAGPPRLAYLDRLLTDLDASMGGALVVRVGRPSEVVAEVAAEIGAASVYATADFGPYGRRRDDAVVAALAPDDVAVHYLDSPYAVRPGTVTTKAGTPYKVFTPFYRSWQSTGWAEPGPAVDVSWVDGRSDRLPPAPALDVDLPAAGEQAAHDRLDRFCEERLDRYGDERDHPGRPGTSGLSPDLKWGSLHPRQLLTRLGPDRSHEVFRSEIAWREFYADVLFDRPDSARQAYVPQMAAMEVDTGPEADRRFEAWAAGATGYPIVDAGMRQLAATGWMHNRVRMITASFLVKDLHLDWTRGARWFMTRLVDGDLASNSHGWQWVAGTGTDAAPYFRIFNPTAQGKKFDPDGTYIRRWIPEIAHLGDRWIHEPWADPAGPPAPYPAPIVDHGAERAIALARFERLKARRS